MTTAANFKLRSFDLNVDNLIADDRFNGLVGGGFDEPVRKDLAKVTLKLMYEFQTSEAWTQFVAGTTLTSKPVIHFAGTAGRVFSITLPYSVLIGPMSTPVKRGDLIIQEATYGGIANTGTSGLTINYGSPNAAG
jgi:hypothetical protein